jgi:hypothetical protein
MEGCALPPLHVCIHPNHGHRGDDQPDGGLHDAADRARLKGRLRNGDEHRRCICRSVPARRAANFIASLDANGTAHIPAR